MNENLLLLDTHVWLYWLFGDPKIEKSSARPLIHQGEHAHRLRLSAISLWEALMLNETGRIRMFGDPRAWLRSAREKFVIHTLPVDERVAVESRLLPGSFHSDPADRVIVATARLAGACLITGDCRILEYADSGNLRVVDLAGRRHGFQPPDH